MGGVYFIRCGFYATFGVLAAIGALSMLEMFTSSTDNSDTSRWNRSGMGVHIDALTGCQYLTSNGITPRLGADGKQICLR
jgi:hypothetical protein